MKRTPFPAGLAKWWADRRWKTGVQLDAMGRWLLVNVPPAGRAWAALLTGRARPPGVFPGWSFGYEYFIERRWMALRRGALWEAALERNLAVPLTVPWHDGTRVAVTLGNDLSLCLYVAGSFEPNEFALLDRVLRPNMTFLDIGANEGLFSLFAARRVGTAGRVVAVEPSARERRQLERNIRRNRLGNVTVVPQALGSEAGTARLHIAGLQHPGHNTLGTFAYEDTGAVAAEDVEVTTLDALGARLSLARIEIVKIDVEGAELKVLTGGRRLLARHRPLVLIEVNEKSLVGQGASAASVVALLRELGYRPHIFSEFTGEIEPVAPGAALSANIVGVP